MTVAELIAKLQEMPPEALVMVRNNAAIDHYRETRGYRAHAWCEIVRGPIGPNAEGISYVIVDGPEPTIPS